ncbi:MAG TPA: hypothetical protein VGR43_00875 [Dehalococcoidia bacterium]|jgi:hypothetical protein|nr:hypothetical protein [Dehalococcoidia bacterium]
MPRRLAIGAIAVTWLAAGMLAPQAAADDVVHISSRVVYDIRPDQGPVRVSWDVTFQNNDPQTTSGGSSGTVAFYQNLTLPVLRGAAALSAVSDSGAGLDVELGEAGRSPTVPATVTFDAPVFFGDAYRFTMAYELANVRVESLLVTPVYAYLPVIAGGDEAAVTVNTPPGEPWSVSVEAGECAQDGSTFNCSGEDAAFLAALVEVSRPDAITSFPFDVTLGGETIGVTLSHFQGEEAAAQHLKDLTTAGLPVIEQLSGFSYPAGATINISQGGKQAVLGYEGVTTCDPADGCQVVVSPVADDVTFLHELAHLWSVIYGKRWLAEGFAQLIAEEAAGVLPEGLIQTRPGEREPAAVDLRLDAWGDVSSLIGAEESEREIENAGYDRSLRFLNQLRFELGSDTLRRANKVLAAEDKATDSKHYLDVLEETSGKSVDGLFAEWVFGPADLALLPARREARARLAELERRAVEEELSDEVPNTIRDDVEAWRFDAALAALTDAEAGLLEYSGLKGELLKLMEETEAAGLSLPSSIEEALKKWDFRDARDMITEAGKAVDAYTQAQERVEAPRGLWKRFGLFGSDPEAQLAEAAEAFGAGDFEKAQERANAAVETMGNASDQAIRRLLVLPLVLSVMAAGIGVAVWFSRRREREYADF